MRKGTTGTDGKPGTGNREAKTQKGQTVKMEKKAEMELEKQKRERIQAERTEKDRRIVDNCKKSECTDKGRKDVLDKKVEETKSEGKAKCASQSAEEVPVSVNKVEQKNVKAISNEKEAKQKGSNPNESKNSGRKSSLEHESDVKGKSNSKNEKKKNKSKSEQKPENSNRSSVSPVKEKVKESHSVEKDEKHVKNPEKEAKADCKDDKVEKDVPEQPKEADKSKKSGRKKSPMKDVNNSKYPLQEEKDQKQENLTEKTKHGATHEDIDEENDVEYAKSNKLPVSQNEKQSDENRNQTADKFVKAKQNKDEVVSEISDSPPGVDETVIPSGSNQQDPPREYACNTEEPKSFIDETETDNDDCHVINQYSMQNKICAENKLECDPIESKNCDIRDVDIKSETMENKTKAMPDVRPKVEEQKEQTSKSGAELDILEDVAIPKNKTKKQKRGKEKQKSNEMTESYIIKSTRQDKCNVDEEETKEIDVLSIDDTKDDIGMEKEHDPQSVEALQQETKPETKKQRRCKDKLKSNPMTESKIIESKHDKYISTETKQDVLQTNVGNNKREFDEEHLSNLEETNKIKPETKKQKRRKDKQTSNQMSENKIIECKSDMCEVPEEKSVALPANDVNVEKAIDIDEELEETKLQETTAESNTEKSPEPAVNLEGDADHFVNQDVENAEWFTPEKKKKKNKRKAQEKEPPKLEELPTDKITSTNTEEKESNVSLPEASLIDSCKDEGKKDEDKKINHAKHEEEEKMQSKEIPEIKNVTSTAERSTILNEIDETVDKENIVETATVDKIENTIEDKSSERVAKNTEINNSEIKRQSDTSSKTNVNDSKTESKGKKKQKKKNGANISDSFETDNVGEKQMEHTKRDSSVEQDSSKTLKAENLDLKADTIDTTVPAKEKNSGLNSQEIKVEATVNPSEDNCDIADMKQSDVHNKMVLPLGLAIERIDSLERSPSYESVRSTLSEERQLGRTDGGTDSEVLASTEQSDSDMIEVKSKKKKKKKKVEMEESMYYEATEPEQTPDAKDTSESNMVQKEEIQKEFKPDTDDIKDSKILEDNKDAKDATGLSENSIQADKPSEESNGESEMFVVKSKKNKKNKQSQRKPDPEPSQKPGNVKSVKKAETDTMKEDSKVSVEKPIAQTETEDGNADSEIAVKNPPIPEDENEVTPVNSDIITDKQSEEKPPELDDDPTAWETAARVNSDESQTDILKNNDSETSADKDVAGSDVTVAIKDPTYIDTTETSTSSCRSSEEREEQKVAKPKESKTEPKTKKKRKKNRK